MPKKRLSSSLEDYLEAIYEISTAKDFAPAHQIAEHLGVGKSSVSWALNKLAEKELVNYAPYEAITLTEKGRHLAAGLHDRHTRIRTFLTDVLGVAEEVAEDNACRIEHVIDKSVLGRMEQFMDFLENCPRLGAQWLKGFGFFCEQGQRRENCPQCLGNLADEIAAVETAAAGGNVPKTSKQRDRHTVERFEAVLHDCGRPFSAAQAAVAEAFMASERHQTVEGLCETVCPEHPEVTRPLVEQTLELLCEHKIARQVRFQDRIVYEHLHPESHHDHLYCVKCGAIVEFYDPRIEALQVENARRADFRGLLHVLNIYGVCQDCIRQEARRRRLTECLAGERVRVVQTVADRETQQRVAEMGLVNGSVLEILNDKCAGDNLIVLAGDTRLMLDAATAAKVRVEPAPETQQAFMRRQRRRHRHGPDRPG